MEGTKKYPSYKDSGLNWIGEIPKHWKKTKVGNIYEITLGKMLQPKPRTNNDLLVPYLKAMNIQDGYIDTSNVDEMYSNNTEIERMSIVEGDLLVCEGGEVARSAIVNSNFEGYIFQNSLHRVRSTNKGMNLYLHYLLNTVRGSGYINILVNKATIAHFTKDKFSSLKICVPPLEEQKAISKYIGIKTAEINALITDKEKLIELLEEKRQAIITEAVIKGLNPDVKMKDSGVEWIGKIPRQWKLSKIKYLAFMKSGESIKNEQIKDQGEYPVYGGGGLRGYTSSFTHKGEHVLIGRQGALCGNVRYANNSFWATEHSVVVKANSNTNITWLGSLLEAMNLNQYSVSAAQPGLSVSTIENLIVPVPPYEEQCEIEEYIKNRDDIAEIVKLQYQQIDKLKEYRQSFIYKAVTGKIDVRNYKGEKVFT